MNSSLPHCSPRARRRRRVPPCSQRRDRVRQCGCGRGQWACCVGVDAVSARCGRAASGRGMARRPPAPAPSPSAPWPTCRPPSSSPSNFTSSTMSTSSREGEPRPCFPLQIQNLHPPRLNILRPQISTMWSLNSAKLKMQLSSLSLN